MKTVILSLFSICFFFSCSRTSNHNIADNKFMNARSSLSESLIDLPIQKQDSIISIKLPQNIDNDGAKAINTSELIDSIQYVPLETTNKCLIQYIEQSLIYKDQIFILDNFGKSVLLFTKQGKFIKRIGRQGKGPQEYINPIFININERNQELYIYDDKPSKFLIYDLAGNYKRDEKVSFRLNDFQILNDTTFVVNTSTRVNLHLNEIANNKIILTDNTWKIFGKGMQYDALNEGALNFSRCGLYRYNNQVCYNPTLSYYVYSINRSGLTPKYFIDAGERALPNGFGNRLDLDGFSAKYDNSESNYVYIDKEIAESDDFLITTIRYKGRRLFFYYCKPTKKLLCSLFDYSESYLFNILTPIRGKSGSEKFYGFISAIEFIQKRDFFAEKKQKIAQNLEAIKDNNNPIFIFYKFKKF